jgi:hypothetical protein
MLTRPLTGKRGLPLEKVLSEHHDAVSRIYLRSDDIVEVHLLATYYNAERVLGVIDRIKQLNANQRLFVLVITDVRSMVTASGMKAVFSPTAVHYSMARAYVFQTYTQFLLARLGKFIVKPKTPMRFFRHRRSAETWLSSFQGYGM